MKDALMPPATPPGDAGISSDRVRADVAGLTHPGRVRPTNEDSFVIFHLGRYLERVASNIPEADLGSHYDETGHLMIVADGVGGQEAGEVASRTALMTTIELVLRSPRWALRLDDPATREEEIAALLGRARNYFQGVHARLRREAEEHPDLAGMGTTLTGAYTVGSDLFVMHVGDSRAYLVRGSRLRRITHDHTMAQEFADLGVIAQAEVPNHELSHVLTRAVGSETDELKTDIHHLDLEDGDRLVLCSDGLTKTTSESEIAAIVAAHPSSEAACRALVERALERGGPDNVTVIVAGYTVT